MLDTEDPCPHEGRVQTPALSAADRGGPRHTRTSLSALPHLENKEDETYFACYKS